MSDISLTENRPNLSFFLVPQWDKEMIDFRPAQRVYSRASDDKPDEEHPASLQFSEPEKRFCTGSKYHGNWDKIGFAGNGVYTYPHGPVYRGNFMDGEFHGEGTITYPSGDRLKGVWDHGKLMSHSFVFNDGLEVTTPWRYCKMPDRRYQIEVNSGLKPACEEYLTAEERPFNIPEGCYDTGDGYFEPDISCVFHQRSESQIGERRRSPSRIPLLEEAEKIKKTYRKSSIHHVGFRSTLYEVWCTGKKKEIERTSHSESEGIQ